MANMLDGHIAEYLRISDDDADLGGEKKESSSIANQRKVLQDYISRHPEFADHTVKEFLDDGFSGVNFHRPGVQNLLKEVQEKKIACIIVKDLSRFGRNYIEVGDYVEQIFPFLGVRFIAVSDHYDSFMNSGGIEVGFKNLIHDLYSRDLSKKVKSVKHMQQEKGIYSGGDVPYGYVRAANMQNREEKKVYLPDPDAAQVVKKIFGLAVDGNTPGRIAKCLNDEKVPTPGAYKNKTANQNYQLKNTRSNLWNSGQVREILQNEVYIGFYICRKSVTIRPREGIKNQKAEYVRLANSHEGLVPEEVFEAAQKMVQVRGRRGNYKKDQNPHVFKGKVKCGYCGYSMNRSGKQGDVRYCCRMGDSCGSHLRINAQILEGVVWEVVQRMVSVCWESKTNPKDHKSEKIQESMTELGKLKGEQRILEMRAEHYKSSRFILYRQWKEGRITKEDYLEKRDEYTGQESDCRAKLRILEERKAVLLINGKKSDTDDCPEGCYHFMALTKELADELIERIDVYGADRVEVGWKFRWWRN